MELTEKIESINQSLIDLFGIDTLSGSPIWRVVWSEDQLEKRLMEYTDSGLQLITPEVREVPKYRQWIKERYVLERLVLIPSVNEKELPSSKISYEPMFVFENNKGDYLPPKLLVAKIVVDTVYAAMGKSNLAKYKDPDTSIESWNERIAKTQEELFGNETDITDALAYGEGISLHIPEKKEN